MDDAEKFWQSQRDSDLPKPNDECINCGKDLGYRVPMCCSGFECGCRGQPIEPVVCSDDCLKVAYPEHWAATVGRKDNGGQSATRVDKP